MGTASDYFASLQLNRQAGLPEPPAAYAARVEAMYEYGAYVADQSGCLPMNGDSDICGAGFVPSVARWFNRSDWDFVRTNGRYGRHPSGEAHATPSSMFPWAGQAVLRSGYGTADSWLWFDVGPFGSNPFHAHRDKLSVLLNAHGAMLLADSGRFAYAGNSFSHTLRPYCHLTTAHNTLRIDGKQQSESPAVATAPRPTTSWSFKPSVDIVQGSMSQYDGLDGNGTHSRTVYHRRGEWFVIVDVVTSDRGGRGVQATWHTHPNASVDLDADGTGIATIRGVDLRSQDPADVHLALVPATGAAGQGWHGSKVVKGVLAGKDGATEDQGWFDEHYSDARPAPTLVYDAVLGPGTKSAVFAWLLVVTTSGTAAAAVATTSTASITTVGGSTVGIAVTVNGDASHITVPFEL